MDLGLKTLTDDQMVELLESVLEELVGRDGFVRDAAQAAIYSKGEKLKVTREAAQAVAKRMRDEYEQEVRSDVARMAKEEYAAGKLRVLTPEDEARLICEAETTIRNKLRDVEASVFTRELLRRCYHAVRMSHVCVSAECLRNGCVFVKLMGDIERLVGTHVLMSNSSPA